MLIFFVLAAMTSLAPNRQHIENATAIAAVVIAEAPLFKGDESRLRTAAFMTAVAFRESSLRNDAIGDHGKARCMFQLWDAPSGVLTDPELCTRIALLRIRESAAACGKDNMLGIYSVGPKGCSSAHARRISRDRLYLAERLARTVAQ